MRVLGVDASLRSTGYGVLEGDRKGQSVLAFGVIKTPRGSTLPATLACIASSLTEVIARHRPEVLALEDIYSYKDARTALLLGHVRGAVLLTCTDQGMATAQYAATTIKKTVTGNGHAEKAQVQRMVARTLSLGKAPPHDAADALAAALTHVFCSGGTAA